MFNGGHWIIIVKDSFRWIVNDLDGRLTGSEVGEEEADEIDDSGVDEVAAFPLSRILTLPIREWHNPLTIELLLLLLVVQSSLQGLSAMTRKPS